MCFLARVDRIVGFLIGEGRSDLEVVSEVSVVKCRFCRKLNCSWSRFVWTAFNGEKVKECAFRGEVGCIREGRHRHWLIFLWGGGYLVLISVLFSLFYPHLLVVLPLKPHQNFWRINKQFFFLLSWQLFNFRVHNRSCKVFVNVLTQPYR